MAIAAQGVVGRISGAVGGIEVAQVGGLSVVKQGKTRGVRTSPAMIKSRAFQGEAVRYWQNLSAANKLAWKMAAEERRRPNRFGDMRTLNSLQLFLTCAHDHTYAYEFWEDTPPLGQVILPLTVGVTLAAGPWLTVAASTWWNHYVYPIMWAYVSRWRHLHAEGRAYKWQRIGPINVTGDAPTFSVPMQAENIEFVEGERVSVRIGFGGDGVWPYVWDKGIVTVTA